MNPYFNTARTHTPSLVVVDVLTKEYFAKNKKALFMRGLPFIIQEYFELSEKNNILKFLRKEYGDTILSARFHSDITSYSNNRIYQDIRLDKYLDSLTIPSESNVLPYAANNPINDQLLNHLGIDYPIIELKEKFRIPNIWIGANGSSTPLHKDSTDNFAIHLFGKKKWTIFSINDYDNLYFENSAYGAYENPHAEFEVSKIDLKNISLEDFPLFRNALPFELVLKEGDLLYLPYGWGHCVENISTSVMVNFWFELNEYRPLVLSIDDIL